MKQYQLHGKRDIDCQIVLLITKILQKLPYSSMPDLFREILANTD